MGNVWLIWEQGKQEWHWIMYEQDGHLAIFTSKEAAEKYVEDHPWCFDGPLSFEKFPVHD